MSQWGHLSDVCAQLLAGTMTPQEARLHDLPTSVLFHYACDCALRSLGLSAAQEGGHLFQKAINTQRAWSEGRVPIEDIHQLRDELTSLRNTPLLETKEEAHDLLVRINAEVVLSALTPDPQEALLLVLRASGSMITDLADETLAWEEAFDREQSWQRSQLVHLLREFLSAHEGLLQLFATRAQMLQAQLGSFQMELEDVLY